MNFVTRLSENKGCNTILMVINWLTKMRHYIVCKADKEETSAEQTVRMYIKHI